MKIKLKVWRQPNTTTKGEFQIYEVNNVLEDMSFFEMLDMLNNSLIQKNESPISFDHDCREGICGTCGVMINGRAHGPLKGVTSCQLHMRSFKDGDTLTIPRRQSSVHIVGEVANPVTLMYDPELSIKGYISRAGGLTPAADSSRTLIITPDGITKVYRNSLFGRGDSILPGSTVVVSRSTRPFDAISITKIITPILADLATSAAAIAAISD